MCRGNASRLLDEWKGTALFPNKERATPLPGDRRKGTALSPTKNVRLIRGDPLQRVQFIAIPSPKRLILRQGKRPCSFIPYCRHRRGDPLECVQFIAIPLTTAQMPVHFDQL